MASQTTSSIASSPPGSSTASPASSPANSPPASPTLTPSTLPPPPPPPASSSAPYHPPPYITTTTSHLPPPPPPPAFPLSAPIIPIHHRPYQTALYPPYPPPPPPPSSSLFSSSSAASSTTPPARYAQISTPYDFLVSYEYFSSPQGFKPYHFRQCYMPTSGVYVIVEKAWSTQVDLDAHAQLLLRYHPGCFADLRHKCSSTAPEGVRRPKVQVCPLFSSEMQLAIDRAVDPGLEEEDPKMFARLTKLSQVEDEICFFIVVQGKDGGMGSKLVVKGSFYQIMTEIFSAAANQYSVVFSGALRERDLGRLGKGARNLSMKVLGVKKRVKCEWEFVRSELRFKRVDNYDDLLVDDEDENVIRVGC